jgi:hypothetical protein
MAFIAEHSIILMVLLARRRPTRVTDHCCYGFIKMNNSSHALQICGINAHTDAGCGLAGLLAGWPAG